VSLEATSILLAWVAIALLAFAMSGLLRQVQQLQAGTLGARILGPEIGSLPRTTLADGRSWARQTVLLFLDATCESCGQIADALDHHAHGSADLELVAIYPGPGNGTAASVQVLEHQQQLFTDYRIPATPFGVRVDARGIVVAAAPLGSVSALDSFVQARSKETA
jgi:hypothetical protein